MWILDFLVQHYSNAPSFKHSEVDEFVGSAFFFQLQPSAFPLKHRLVTSPLTLHSRFRWVTCQMDYLCELPNDAARRVALDCLPPDLKSTYERILDRVEAS